MWGVTTRWVHDKKYTDPQQPDNVQGKFKPNYARRYNVYGYPQC